MFNSLFKVKFPRLFFFGAAFVIFILFPGISIYSYIAIIITLYQFLLLFSSIGYVIPIRYLFGAFMCLQMLLGPTLAYNGLDKFQVGYYKMQVPEDVYFSYVIPAVILFILGLHIKAGNLLGEQIAQNKIKAYVQANTQLTYIFIGVGLFCSVLINILGSWDVPFIITVLANLKYVGVFMFIIGIKKIKPVPLILVYGSVISSSIIGGMFQDLLTWLIFLGAVLAIKYKPSEKLKLLFIFLFVLMTVSIQLLKGGYRRATWQGGQEVGFSTWTKTYEEQNRQGSFFNPVQLAESNIRMNQGYIVTNIMKKVPERVPYANGSEMVEILTAALFPRFIAPNKLKAGDKQLFMKYTDMSLLNTTSMGLSSVGDGYINFGVVGGSIFMFFLGLLYNQVLKLFYKFSINIPILLLFTPLVFYYPIRPDCELQTILGHLIKSCMILILVFIVWKRTFTMRSTSLSHRLQLSSS